MAQGPAPARRFGPALRGGSYRPLTGARSGADPRDGACSILEEIGLASATPTCVETVTSRPAASLTDDGRLLFPTEMVEQVPSRLPGRELQALCPGFGRTGPSAKSSTRVHLGTSGAAVHIVDSEDPGGPRFDPRRTSTTWRAWPRRCPTFTCSSARWWRATSPTPHAMDLNTAYACAGGHGQARSAPSFTSVRNHARRGGNVPPDRRRRSGLPRAAVLLCLHLLHGAAPDVRRGSARRHRVSRPSTGVPLKLVSAGQAGRDQPGTAGRRGRATDGRGAGGPRLCEPALAGTSRRSSARCPSSRTCAPAPCPAAAPSRGS